MPTISDAQNTTSSRQSGGVTATSGSTGINILLEASCPEAAHDAACREPTPPSFPETHAQYVKDIVLWAIPPLGAPAPPIYWMKGSAEVGKSAIARLCAEVLETRKKLGAAYFFSSNKVTEANKTEKFFPSIASQLSTIHPPYRELIGNKLRHDKTLINQTMQLQFQSLIEEPLRELAKQGKGIRNRTAVVIDGLDQCEGADEQGEIIRIISKAVSDGSLPLCWAFFSRPEPHVEAAFTGITVASHCHKVILPTRRDDDGDIELYLRNGFENILRHSDISVGSQWPSFEDMQIIVGAARREVTYAAMVLRFVEHLGAPEPQKRLRMVIDDILDRRNRRDPHAASSSNTPTTELDAFYRLILRHIPPEILPSVHLLLAVLGRGEDNSAVVTANVLGLSKDKFESVCKHVCAVVYLQDTGKGLEQDSTTGTSLTYTQLSNSDLAEYLVRAMSGLEVKVSFYHKSFSDFILDPAHSGSYCAKGSKALAKHFLKIRLEYDRTYGWNGSELVLAPGVPGFASSLSYPYKDEFVNFIIKTLSYIDLGVEDGWSFPAPGGGDRFNAECDFRKHLYAHTDFWSKFMMSRLIHGTFWGYKCRGKLYLGTRIFWIPLDGFDVNVFKLMIKERLQANIIQRCRPNLTSRIKSFFRDKPQKHFESELYRMGHGEKSIFWYWEIDYKLQHYREFRAIDLAEGEKRFREENFASWPELETPPA